MIDLSGKFITFEGIDGCGKTTQVKAVVEALKNDGHSVVSTREPGGTALGAKLRDILLDLEDDDMDPGCELLLYSADRAQHLHSVIEPALAEGRCVVSDRYYDSTMAYQAVGIPNRSYFRQMIEGFCLSVIRNRVPDLTILISIEPHVAMARIQAGSMFDRFDAQDAEFFGKVHASYHSLAERYPERIVAVNGNQRAEALTEEIMGVIAARFAPKSRSYEDVLQKVRSQAIAEGMPLLTEDEVLEKRKERLVG